MGMAGGSVLVLDDDPTVGLVLVAAAQALGLEARLCEQAEAFFEQLASWQPSHVAIDLTLPDTSGVEVLRRMAATGARARVIVFSGVGAVELEAALDVARDLGLDTMGVLPKPFRLAQLRALLANVG
jgi:DNA-binding response OmpR family regulator